MGGKLKLKGDKKEKKRKKRAEGSAEPAEDGEQDEEELDLPEYSADPIVGTGKLASSGVVVMGIDTDFSAELEVAEDSKLMRRLAAIQSLTRHFPAPHAMHSSPAHAAYPSCEAVVV